MMKAGLRVGDKSSRAKRRGGTMLGFGGRLKGGRGTYRHHHPEPCWHGIVLYSSAPHLPRGVPIGGGGKDQLRLTPSCKQ